MIYENNEEILNGEPLYTKVQRFYLRNTQSEEKYRDLRVTVDISTSFSKVTKHTLNIQVSDDDDPFFFYSLILTEDDYQRLKHLQGLLVDFESFPTQVIRLLEQCKEHESNGSKLLLILEEEKIPESPVGASKTCLKIVETNNFKHLCHLILQIEAGNDNDIKKLMLKKIKTLKEQVHKAERCIGDLEAQLFSKAKSVELKEQELHEIRHRWKEDKLAFKAESSKELNEETEKLRKAQLDWQLKVQREKNELEERYQSELKERESEISRLRIENQIFQEKRTLGDSTINDQVRRIENLEKELNSLRSELLSVRKQNAKLDSDYHEKDKLVHGLKTRLAVAEQESKDMAMLMKKHQELSNIANEQKNRLEEMMCEKDKNIQRKQVTIQNLSDELVKANEIITKIQKDLSVTNQKLKVRTVIALEQEKVVETNSKKISQLEEKLSSRENKIDTLLTSERKLKNSISDFKETIEAKEKKIRDNERMIDWLNKRLTEQSRSSYAQTNHSPLQNGAIGSTATSTPYPVYRAPDQVPFSVTNITPPLVSHNNSPKQSPELVDQMTRIDNIENSHNGVKPKLQETLKNDSNPGKQVKKKSVDGYITTEDVIREDIFFEIVEPEELQYSYRTRPAKNFGTHFPNDVIYKNIKLVPVDPPDGCGKPINFLLLAGGVALVDRGGCSFAEKVYQAEVAGAVAVIVSDNVQSDEYFVEMMDDGFSRELNIPASFLLGKNGQRIRHTLKELDMEYALINIPKNFTYTSLPEWHQPPWIPW